MIGFKDGNSSNILTALELIGILMAIRKDSGENCQIWLSSDEEGNNFSPMHKDANISIGVDKENKRVIFFPQD